jgi:hypothetical protein
MPGPGKASSAEKVVATLLDGSPYDIDDPLDRWPDEFPEGFVAIRDDEKVEFRYDPKKIDGRGREIVMHYYRGTKHWLDDYTKRPRTCPMGVWTARNVEDAFALVARESKRWEDGGWTIQPLNEM